MERKLSLATIVGVLSAISLVLWSANSSAVALWLDHASFLAFVLKSFVVAPKLYAIPFDVPTGYASIGFALLGTAACGLLWYLAYKRFRGAEEAAPMATVIALVAAVSPPTLLAFIRWPDGHGALSSAVIALTQVATALLAIIGLRFVSPAVTPAHSNDVLDFGANRRSPGLNDVSDGLPSWMLWLIAVLALLYWLTVFLAGLSAIQGYDSFSDHLARPARWLVTNSLELGVPGEVVTYYPGNFELLVRWVLNFGSDRLAFIASYGSSIVSLWVIYRIAREIGQSKKAALVSMFAAASLQVLAYQSVVVYSDTFTALCLLLATWLLVIYARKKSSTLFLSFAFGLAIGLALGTKYSAGPPAVVLSLIWLWYASRGQSHDDLQQPLIDFRSLFRESAAYTVGVMPGMLFWYFRNSVVHANPIYPLSVAGLPGIPLPQLLAGAPGPESFWQKIAYPWMEAGHISGYETGLGPAVAAVVIIALLLAPVTGRGNKSHRLVLTILVGAILAWLQTGVLVPRYGLFPIMLSFVFVGSMLAMLRSIVLQTVTVVAIGGTFIALGFEFAGGAAYNMLFYDSQPPIPAVIETLPASRILNLAGQPAGYYAMGRDYRHRVITPFGHMDPEEVRAAGIQYLLLLDSEEEAYTASLQIELVERWSRPNWRSLSLWRLY